MLNIIKINNIFLIKNMITNVFLRMQFSVKRNKYILYNYNNYLTHGLKMG